MTTIVIGGDCATTTMLALAAGWPDEHATEVVAVEADPTGGSLAAWLDTPLSPSLSAIVTNLHHTVSNGATPATQWSAIEAMIRRSAAGVRFVPAPFRVREARGAVHEADLAFLPLLATAPQVVALVDVGRIDPLRLSGPVPAAELTVVVHRQDTSSAPAATVRLERLAETVAALHDAGNVVAVALIGDDPFSLDEVVEFTSPNGPAWELAPDPLSAAVLAGRSGVSARRLARLPLMRSAARAAADLARLVDDALPAELDADLQITRGGSR